MSRLNDIVRQILKMLLWFTFAFIVIAGARLPFLFVYYLPHHLPFEPWVVLIPLLGALWGPPAMLGAALAVGLGDRLSGMYAGLESYHVAGLMAWGWSAWTLTRGSMPASLWGASLHWLTASLPGLAAAVTAMAMGSEIMRFYPFSYVAGIALINHAVFLTVFGLMFYRVAVRYLTPKLGYWGENRKTPARYPSVYGRVLQYAGGFGALATGLFISVRLGYGPLDPVILGDTAGYTLLPGVAPFLFLMLIGTLCPPTRGKG
jgi:hypothetical protein